MNYLDFELEISNRSGREYNVVVIRSAAGEAREIMRFPFDDIALESRLKDLQIALLRSGGKQRRILSREEQNVQDFGRALFHALFIGKVRSRYDVGRHIAIQHSMGVRLKLRILPPNLAALPWEFMYDDNEAEYLCLSSRTPIVRYLELPRPPQPLAVTPPLRILGMTANPKDLIDLEIDHEKQRVERAISSLQSKGLVELTWLQGQTSQDLQRAMRQGTWHIFHFIGHGDFNSYTDEGLIALANEEGKADFLSATHLGRLLADHHSLRLVVLNSCEGARGSSLDIFSSTAAILVRRGIPAVLAMQYAITDRAAIKLSHAFYEALTDGLPVDAAVSEARKAVSLSIKNTLEWGTPVLYMHSPNGVLFNLVQKSMLNERQQNQSAIVASSVTRTVIEEPNYVTPTFKLKENTFAVLSLISRMNLDWERKRDLRKRLVALAIYVNWMMDTFNEACLASDITLHPNTLEVLLSNNKLNYIGTYRLFIYHNQIHLGDFDKECRRRIEDHKSLTTLYFFEESFDKLLSILSCIFKFINSRLISENEIMENQEVWEAFLIQSGWATRMVEKPIIQEGYQDKPAILVSSASKASNLEEPNSTEPTFKLKEKTFLAFNLISRIEQDWKKQRGYRKQILALALYINWIMNTFAEVCLANGFKLNPNTLERLLSSHDLRYLGNYRFKIEHNQIDIDNFSLLCYEVLDGDYFEKTQDFIEESSIVLKRILSCIFKFINAHLVSETERRKNQEVWEITLERIGVTFG